MKLAKEVEWNENVIEVEELESKIAPESTAAVLDRVEELESRIAPESTAGFLE